MTAQYQDPEKHNVAAAREREAALKSIGDILSEEVIGVPVEHEGQEARSADEETLAVQGLEDALREHRRAFRGTYREHTQPLRPSVSYAANAALERANAVLETKGRELMQIRYQSPKRLSSPE